ncbi:hypothetical protein BG003_000729 [Podila horticola]|nr:hypothetical protein BG003_000729 [Podila horticola]
MTMDMDTDPRLPFFEQTTASELPPIESTALSETTPTTSTNFASIALNQLPIEILGIIRNNFNDPYDLLFYSHTCRLFYHIVDGWCWFRLYKAQLPRWSLHVQFDDLSDSNEWKVLVLEDYLKKQGPWSARSSGVVTSSSAAASDQQPLMHMQDNLSAEHVTQPQEEINEMIDSRLFINLDDAQHIRPKSMLPGGWQNVGPPVSSTDKPSGRTLAAYIQSHSFDTETDHQIVLYTLPDHETPVATLSSDYWSAPEDDQLLWHTHPEGAPNVAQVMDILYCPHQRDSRNRARVLIALAFGQGSGPLSEISDENNILDVWMLIKVLEVYIPDTLPSTTLPAHVISETSQRPGPRLVCPKLDPDKGRVVNIVPIRMQPMEMIRGRMVKLYTTPDPVTGVRKDCVALFGILHEVANPSLTSPAIVVKGSLFGPSPSWQFQEARSEVGASASCMALFPPYSEFEQLMVVFYPQGQGEIWNWHEMKVVARLGTRSQEELDLAHQTAKKKRADQMLDNNIIINNNNNNNNNNNSSSSNNIININNIDNNNNNNYLKNVGRDHESRNIVQLYCWGVHVVHAVEAPGQQYEGKTTLGRGDFRIVTMADGAAKEWESCWWHVKGSILRKYLGISNELTSELFTSTSTSTTTTTTVTESGLESTLNQETFEQLIGYSGRHYESWTLGRAVTLRERLQRLVPPSNKFGQSSGVPIPYGVALTPAQPPRPEKHLLFIAYLVWEHYRIALTSQYGLCLVDMDQETVGDYKGEDLARDMTLTQNKQLVTFLEDSASDPLVDIATVGNALFITRKFSHMVWPLRRRLGMQLSR